MKTTLKCFIAAIGLLVLGLTSTLPAGTWNPAGGGSWAVPGNWSDATVPNASGASAVFNASAAANRAVTTDSGAPGFTVGEIIYNSTAATTQTTSINTGTAGSNLKFDYAGPTEALIHTSGAGTGNLTIAVPTILNENLTVATHQLAPASAAGSVNLTTSMSGVGGVTKVGQGLMTFGTGAKTYTGATVLNDGRTRMSVAAHPTATSGLTINAGGQLTLISAGTYTFGPNAMNLNGTGPGGGPFAPFPGAIRNDTNLAATITNAVNLLGPTTIHVQGSATGSTTLSGNVGGAGSLIAGANPHDANLGQLVLSGSNSYSGGSIARAGSLVAAAGSVNAFGTGDVNVESASVIFAGSQARISIQTGATNAIDDSAWLSLAGGGAANTADDGHADLGAGINEVVRRIYLGGVVKIPGTYGSSSSAATYKFDEYFSGTGIVTVLVPEPTSFALVLLGILGLAGTRSRR